MNLIPGKVLETSIYHDNILLFSSGDSVQSIALVVTDATSTCGYDILEKGAGDSNNLLCEVKPDEPNSIFLPDGAHIIISP